MQIHHLKIFISSTFHDMKEEREILLKDTFLELKKIAKKRDVEITEIDLRTGITKEQEQSGQIVKICLDEIERCSDSPIFFLGMLGNRYGWKDWHLHTNKETLENPQYSWVKEHIGKSVTELEIVSAVERDKNRNRAFFYLKEDKSDDDNKLIELKNRLIEKSKRDNSLYVTRYKDGADFKKQTIDSFNQVLEELYPKNEKLSEVEKLRITHQIFAKSRQKIYIPHAKNEAILSEFIKSDQDRLLLYGESGYGKSALIANYFESFKEHNDSFVIEHYIGGAGELSSDLHQSLRRVMLEIKEQFNLPDELPSEPQKIMDEFALWLHRVKRPTIIIFDGYNQIEDEMKEKLFLYLPDKLEHVKLIFTSIRDDYEIDNRHKIEALEREEQKALITNYLKGYGKTLDNETKEQIVAHPQTDNTLFLKTLLDEIRLLGSFENLQNDIESYLNAKDVVELFSKIFERLERDYRENLAREVLSLLYVSRDGLSEDNLMEIINQNSTEKLTRLEFSPLFLAVEEHLIDRGGLYGFFHGFILEAVEKRYLSLDELVNVERRRIADYFELREINSQRVRELPFQLFEVGDRERLYHVIFDVEFFYIAQKMNQYELFKYIRFVEKKDDIIGKLCIWLLKKSYFNTQVMHEIANSFKSYGKYKESILVHQKTLKIKKSILDDKHFDTANSYHDLAETFRYAGQYKKALPFYLKALSIREYVFGKEHVDIATSYNDLGLLYKFIGEYKKALTLYQKASKMWAKLVGIHHPDISQSYNNLGALYLDIKEYAKALFYFNKALNIRENILGKNHPQTGTVYNNIAVTYQLLNKYKEAFPFLEKDLKISEVLLGKNHSDTAVCYHNLGRSYKYMGEYTKALIFYEKDLKITLNILGETHLSTAITYNSLAELYELVKKYDEAKQFYTKALRIREKILPFTHTDLIDSKKVLKMVKQKLKKNNEF